MMEMVRLALSLHRGWFSDVLLFVTCHSCTDYSQSFEAILLTPKDGVAKCLAVCPHGKLSVCCMAVCPHELDVYAAWLHVHMVS